MAWLLFILGLVLYLIIRYQVAPRTKTPVWLLWFVLMVPVFIRFFWLVVYGESQEMPWTLLITSLVVSGLSYVLLVQAGQQTPPTNSRPSDSSKSSEQTEEVSVPATTTPVKLIDTAEEQQLQNCFPWSIFYLQNIDHRPQAVICRGQLRAEPTLAYQTIQENIEAQFGDRFLVIFQNGLPEQPYFAIVPNPKPHQASVGLRLPLMIGFMLATLFTTTCVGLLLANPDLADSLPDSFEVVLESPSLLTLGLPYSLSLMLILGVHEMGHFLTARYYKLKASLPLFIPAPIFLGTLGAFIQVRSPMPNRKTLFDVGIAGPIAGLVVTLPLLIWGLQHSSLVGLPPTAEIESPAAAFDPKLSLLFFLIARAVFGSDLGLNQGIQLHPVAVAGSIGLLVTALNLIPVGQLDGGHIVHAMYGQRKAMVIAQISRILLVILAFVQQPILRLWAIILLFFPAINQPALNDVCELDNRRDFLGLAALAVLLAIILRAPDALVELLTTTNPTP